MRYNLTILQKGMILTSVPLLFMAVFVVLLIRIERDNGATEEIYLHSKEVTEASQQLARRLSAAEAGVSTYLATGSAAELSPYQAARISIPANIRRLQMLDSDVQQQTLIRRLGRTASAELTSLDEVLRMEHSGARQNAVRTLKAPVHQENLNQFQEDWREFRQRHEVLDAERRTEVARSWERLYWLLVGGAAADVILTLLLSLLFSHGIHDRLFVVAQNAQRLAEGRKIADPMRGSDEIAEVDRVFHQMADALEEAAQKERAMVENALDVICSLDAEGRFVRVSGASQKLWGYQPGELVGRNYRELVMEEDRGPTDEAFRQAKAGKPIFNLENQCLNPDNSPVAMIWSMYWSAADNLMFCVAHDITERKKAEARIWHQAYHDTLTDLANRMLFNDRLTQALAQARRNKKRLAVMFLDLDRFKTINDSLGHSTGDELLKEVAKRLQSCIRATDTVARMGGDEFTVLLSQIAEREDAATVAAKIRDTMRLPWTFGEYELHLTVSIGIALYPDDGEDAETLLHHADAAQYRIKSEQRNNFQFYTAALNQSAAYRLTLENHLRHALERDELTVHYQPQVDIRSGEIVGVEALVRWDNPKLGLISPTQFIPIAEDIGLIVAIGKWILRTACIQHKSWQENGFSSLRLAVNLSARQVQQPDLVQTIRDVLEETRMDPASLELEITETAAMDMDGSVNVLKELRGLGVGISIDDFGTGYSSLNYLTRFPFDSLKIDRSFVKDLGQEPEAAAIVMTVITLAQSLNRRVIAEGVETEEQLDFLRDQQCDERQGFLFCEPIPAPALTRLLDRTRDDGPLAPLRVEG